MKNNLSFESFCQTYKLRLAKEKNSDVFTSTHTQIAYMAYLYGKSDVINELISFCKKTGICKKEDLFIIKNVFLDENLLKLNDILPINVDKNEIK